MEIDQLENLIVIADCGTLTAASEQLRISQSALSRSIQRLEGELGCHLFDRTKNRMSLNGVGELVLGHARLVVGDVARLKEAVGDRIRKQSTLHISSCAPAPLWRLIPLIVEREPDLLVSPKLESLKGIEADLMNGAIDLAVLPYKPALPNLVSIPFMQESLRAALPIGHPLAERESIELSELDGETFLMYHGVGFWRELLDEHVPNAHYVLQDDYLIFNQLSQTSPLPGFVTDASETERFIGDRRIIPIADEDANVHYHLVALSTTDQKWISFFDWVEKRLVL